MTKSVFVETRYGNHEVVLERDDRRGYIAVASALPGVITWGKNLTHAKEMAKEAIELCIESLVQEKSGKSAGSPRRDFHKSRRVGVPVAV